MSPRRFDGWEPAERHEHFDAGGNPTGYTVVSREPEWDDHSRAEALAAVQLENLTCRRCGQYMSQVMAKSEDDSPVVVWRSGKAYRVLELRCEACASLETVERDASEADKKHEKQSPPARGRAQPKDGRRFVAKETDDPRGR